MKTMLQLSGLLAYFIFIILLMGALVGAAVGAAAAAIFRNGWFRVALDAALGAVGLAGTIIVFAVLPWPRNTVAIVENGNVVGWSTMNRFQHEWPAGWTVAVLLPIAQEVNQRRRRAQLK